MQFSNCNDPALLSVHLAPSFTGTGKRYEIYINGFKEGELNAVDKKVAEVRFWNYCQNHELIALKLAGKANVIVEEKKGKP